MILYQKTFLKGKTNFGIQKENKCVCHCIKFELFLRCILLIFQKDRKINKMKSYLILFFLMNFIIIGTVAKIKFDINILILQ